MDPLLRLPEASLTAIVGYGREWKRRGGGGGVRWGVSRGGVETTPGG